MGQNEAIRLDLDDDEIDEFEDDPVERGRLAAFDHVPASEVQRHLAALLKRAREEQERIVLTQWGKPIAAIVPLEDVELLVDIEDMIDIELADEAAERARREGTVPWEQVKAGLREA